MRHQEGLHALGNIFDVSLSAKNYTKALFNPSL